MGYRYEEMGCRNCGITTHIIRKKYGKSVKGKGKGYKGLRREVIKCLSCQFKIIRNTKKEEQIKRTTFISFRQ